MHARHVLLGILHMWATPQPADVLLTGSAAHMELAGAGAGAAAPVTPDRERERWLGKCLKPQVVSYHVIMTLLFKHV